jgi:hypothetical protein
VYPNPFTESFTIEIPHTDAKCFVHLTDITGRVIFSESIFTQNESEHIIALENIIPGIYFLSLQSTAGRETVKLIKK